MNTKTIGFIKENNEGRALELSESLKLMNNVLDKLLKDIILNNQKLQKNKDYDSVIESIKAQEDINNQIDFNLKLVDKIDIQINSTEEYDNKNEVEQSEEGDISDYDEYSVDTNIPHNLQEDFRFKRPHAFELQGKLVNVSTWREMLISTCNLLHKINPDIFKSFVTDKSMSWGNTYNFAKDKSLLREPTLIKGSKVYIETSKDSIAVKQLIIRMLNKYGIDISEYKVYLRADYSPKYQDKEQQDTEKKIV